MLFTWLIQSGGGEGEEQGCVVREREGERESRGGREGKRERERERRRE